MRNRIDRSSSFIGEENLISIIQNTPKNTENPNKFLKFFDFCFQFCSKNSFVESSHSEPINSKLKSTVKTSSNSNHIFTEIKIKEKNEKCFFRKFFKNKLSCQENLTQNQNFPLDSFFFLNSRSFTILVKYYIVYKNKKLEDNISQIEKLMIELSEKHQFILNFDIDIEKNCTLKEKLGKIIINLDFKDSIVKKIRKNNRFNCLKICEGDFIPQSDSIKCSLNNMKFLKNKNLANLAVINGYSFKRLTNIKSKLIKIYVKLIGKALIYTNEMIVVFSNEFKIKDAAEIFEKSLNNMSSEPLSISIRIFSISNSENPDFLVYYSPNNEKLARLECSYLLSLINPDNFNSQLETIFLANRLRLLKQIIINHRLMKIEIPLLEYILKILIDYQLISSSIVKLYFPFMDYYVKQSKDNSFLPNNNTPIIHHKNDLLNNSFILENSLENEKSKHFEMDKNNINNNHFSFTDKYYEFSSYTSKIDEFNTNNVSNNNEINDKYEILERIGCVSLDGFEMSKKWEFKDYILISEKEENVKEKIVGIKKQKSKSSI